MTNNERRRAFDLRLKGCTWAEIGRDLGYTYQAVQQDMEHVLTATFPNECRCPYPALADYIRLHHEGSISEFIRECGLPRKKSFNIIMGREPMTEDVEDRISFHTGIRKALLHQRRANPDG